MRSYYNHALEGNVLAGLQAIDYTPTNLLEEVKRRIREENKKKQDD